MTRIFDKTKNISPFFRRLDTIARFLEVDQTWTAVSYIGKNLYISNKLEYALSDYPEKLKSLSKGVKLLINFENNNIKHNIQIAYNRIYGSNIEENKVQFSLAKWCEHLDKNIKKSPKANYKILTKESYDFTNPFKQYGYIKAVKFFLEELKPDKINPLDLDKADKQNLKLMHKNLQKMHARAYQDAHKIVELMTTDKFAELKQAIKNFEDGGFIFPYEESDEGKDHHAEMNIIRFIYENENSGEFYIGISKLSCVNCYNVIYSFSDQEQLEIFIRGAHKFQFPSRQATIWEKQATAEELEYFKPEVSLENASPLFADYSDSEPELELIDALSYSAEAEL